MVGGRKNDAQNPAYAVVFDVEFTAWQGVMQTRWMNPGQFKEIIQLAAVKVDAAYCVLDRFDVLVKPKVNPVLSAYVEQVTGITNADLQAHGTHFPDAYAAFREFVGDLPLLAFGRDDLVLRQNLRLNAMAERIPPYSDVREWMKTLGIDVLAVHGCDVGPALGVPFAGRPHNALDDAASLAAGIAKTVAGGAAGPLMHRAATSSEPERIAVALHMAPHPEGGAYVETFRDSATVSGRAHSTAIYFLLRAGEESRKHRVDAAEVWHFYRGAPLELVVEAEGSPPEYRILGPDVEAGQCPQIVVAPRAWQAARSLGEYTLVGCTVAPGFEFAKFEMAPQ